MKKSLSHKLQQQIHSIALEMKKQEKLPTHQLLLEELLSMRDYARHPQQLLSKEIAQYLSNIEEDKNRPNPNLLNNQLPFMKNRLIEQRKVADSDPKMVDEEVTEQLKKKLKKQDAKDSNALKIDMNKILNLDEIGGIDKIIESIKYNIYLPLENPQVFAQLNVTPPKGTLLTGPAGSGKTALGLAICKDINQKLGYPFYFKQSTEIVGGISGESEKNLRAVFIDACQNAPSVIFIDEIDAIAGSRERASKEMEKRIVSELLSCLDKLPDNVHVIAATSRPESLEQSIRRGGRFDTEILLPVPDEPARKQILHFLTKNNPLDPSISISYLAKCTPGYVAADLTSLVRKAGLFAVKRIVTQHKDRPLKETALGPHEQPPEALDSGLALENTGLGPEGSAPNSITQVDFDQALVEVQPTGKREGFASIPNVTWEDIGGLANLKEELINNIILPIEQPENFQKFNIMSPIGVLLYGPPGVGKTLLAKATANASKANFISVKGPELLNKYVGESERAVRSVFSRANASAPCIIFFDEIDALCPKRGQGDGNQVTERIVNALLVEMDGVDVRKQVYIIAATNRPDILDPALLRGGRLDKQLYVPLPNHVDRLSILQALTRKMPCEDTVDLKSLAEQKKCEGFSGADLHTLVKEAGLKAILKKSEKVAMEDFLASLDYLMPSISPQNRQEYEKYQKYFRQHKNSMSNITL